MDIYANWMIQNERKQIMSNKVATERTLQQVVEAMGGDAATETNSNKVATEDTLQKLLAVADDIPGQMNSPRYGVTGLLNESPLLLP